MKVTNTEFSTMTDKASPDSPMIKNIIMAFLFGGAICTIGQLLSNLYVSAGMSKLDAGTLVSCTLIFLSAVVTGLGLYDNVAKHAGAGTIVPITGFANSIVAPAIEFKSEGLVMGMGAKMFIMAGPVLVFGISSSVIYGVILWIISNI